MKGKIKIDRELCKGCKYCLAACPKGMLAIETEFNKMGYFPAYSKDIEECTGCGLCAQMCPEIAIEVWVTNNKKKA